MFPCGSDDECFTWLCSSPTSTHIDELITSSWCCLPFLIIFVVFIFSSTSTFLGVKCNNLYLYSIIQYSMYRGVFWSAERCLFNFFKLLLFSFFYQKKIFSMFTFSLVSTSRKYTDKKRKCKSFLEHNYTFVVVNIGDYSNPWLLKSTHKSFHIKFDIRLK